jgi:tRNA threonylcarbamoyladenosine biosynthesis protein TsaB
MKLLAFDTATEACAAALWLDGELLERFELGTRHAERLLPMIEELLAQAQLSLKQLDAIAFVRGPGSFTGLRIGAGVAQGLGFGADVPLVPVSSLAALAQGVDAPKVLAFFDARMQQVYYGAYSKNADGIAELHGPEIVAAPEDVPLPPGSGWVAAGGGWEAYQDVLSRRLGVDGIAGAYPRAGALARIAVLDYAAGCAIAPEQALPTYLRDDVAVKSKSG